MHYKKHYKYFRCIQTQVITDTKHILRILVAYMPKFKAQLGLMFPSHLPFRCSKDLSLISEMFWFLLWHLSVSAKTWTIAYIRPRSNIKFRVCSVFTLKELANSCVHFSLINCWGPYNWSGVCTIHANWGRIESCKIGKIWVWIEKCTKK